jgi:hypothetical protein
MVANDLTIIKLGTTLINKVYKGAVLIYNKVFGINYTNDSNEFEYALSDKTRCFDFDGVDDTFLTPFYMNQIVNGTFEFYINTTDTIGMLFSASSSTYMGVWQAGNGTAISSGVSGAEYYIDDVLLINMTRNGLYVAMCDGITHKVTVKNVTFNWGTIKAYWFYYVNAGAPQYNAKAKCHSLKIDFTSNGTWDVVYDMNETSGTVLNDTSGNGYNATLLNINQSTFFTVIGGDNKITNQGTSSTNDLLLYTGESLEVGSTQVFSLGTTGQTVAVYRTLTAEWTYHTAPYTLTAGTYCHMAVLAKVPSTEDKAYLEANIHALADLWFGRATGLTSIVKADIQHFYIPKVEQGSELFDLCNKVTTYLDRTSYGLTSNVAKDGLLWESRTTGRLGAIADGGTGTDGTGLNWRGAENDMVGMKFTAPTYINSMRAFNGSSYTITEISLHTWDRATNTWTLHTPTLREDNGLFTSNTWSPWWVINGTYDGIAIKVDSAGTTAGISEIDISYERNVSITIPNYAATMYTNADLNPKGQQTINMIFDGTGRATGVDYSNLRIPSSITLDTKFNKASIGRYIIEQTVTGLLENLDSFGVGLGTFSQRTEVRKLVYERFDIEGTEIATEGEFNDASSISLYTTGGRNGTWLRWDEAGFLVAGISYATSYLWRNQNIPGGKTYRVRYNTNGNAHYVRLGGVSKYITSGVVDVEIDTTVDSILTLMNTYNGPFTITVDNLSIKLKYTDTEEYYIDDVLQPYIPKSLLFGNLTLASVPSIGHKDVGVTLGNTTVSN